MARPFPYAFIACPCADSPIPDSLDDEQTLDPRSPRSNFSLYPPEQLLYCEDCHQIKCPRCITEEIVCWYCPSCLFETPSSMVRSEGNRCARNCFNCPVCTAPLAVTTLENATGSSQQGPWVLACSYCMWTTLDVGLQFDKPTNLRAQLSKMTDASRGRQPSKTFSDLKSPLATSASIDDQFDNVSSSPNPPSTPAPEGPLAPDARFAALKSFYKNQLAAVSSSSSDPDLGSPGALHRIMSLYASSSRFSLYPGAGKKPKSRPPVMREAISTSEGLKMPAPDADDAAIQRLVAEDGGWDSVASLEQRRFQSPDARFVDDLLPLPVLLRTKRSKRCKSCKHILVKPEFKPSSTRFRIRLIALSYIPLPTLRPLIPTPGLIPPSLPSPATSSVAPNLDSLPPLKPVQLLLTLKNHMFDPVRVTLATPSVTPGRVASKVTILCPQFDLGANSDVWDEALQGATPAGGGGGSTSATNAANDPRSSRSGTLGAGSSEKVAEAGKVWDKGRNWTTVVLEVVPGPLPGGAQNSSKSTPMGTGDEDTYEENKNRDSDDDNEDSDDDDDDDSLPDMKNLDWSGQNTDPGQKLQPDEDILEIPVFVRMEWDSDNQIDEHGGGHQSSDTVKRELAYWMVLGAGRISKELTA
ncbi:putative dynactin Arp1 p62 subunit RO2 [Aspergillus melleus]|uniref:putative dynactin Arp1 p62 subunit RO2 n=1 Tax=Aspergillus melleus TaxID=138277 RepID=UPI001E8EED3E|nr:uncharacterized protein LDX57_001567 [Aspergillus melleus]KAH8423809.1 hypothetical protein LDX57_001567 [Aspergillus melleus]